MTEQTPAPAPTTQATPVAGPLTVREISADEAVETLLELGGSFLQTPAWGRAKAGWRRTHLGWFDASGRRVGAGLVLSRTIPRLSRSYAYLPEGPGLPWDVVATDPSAWIDPLVAWAKSTKAFALRLGYPSSRASGTESRSRSRSSTTACSASRASPPRSTTRLLAASRPGSTANQWLALGADGVAVGQPRLLCVVDLRDRTDADLLKGMNQQWRRNVKKARRPGCRCAPSARRGSTPSTPSTSSRPSATTSCQAQGVLRGHGQLLRLRRRQRQGGVGVLLRGPRRWRRARVGADDPVRPHLLLPLRGLDRAQPRRPRLERAPVAGDA